MLVWKEIGKELRKAEWSEPSDWCKTDPEWSRGREKFWWKHLSLQHKYGSAKPLKSPWAKINNNLLISPNTHIQISTSKSLFKFFQGSKNIFILLFFLNYGTKKCPLITFVFCLLKMFWGLPWWRSGWESACQCRGHGFGPWSGKIPHAAEQLDPWATTTEPARLEPVLRNKRGHDSERPAHCDEEWPPLAATKESPRTETKTQHSQK